MSKKIRTTVGFFLLVAIVMGIWLTYKNLGASHANQAVIPGQDDKSFDFGEKSINYLEEGGELELPVNGATGYAPVELTLRESPDISGNIILILNPGQGFTIVAEAGEWWKIDFGGNIGWVMSQYCLVNLPDVIPSIVYNNSNAEASKMKSSGKSIDNITGMALYQTSGYNKRFEEDVYVVPVLYPTAKKINQAQQAARKEGNTLIIYEAFRPYEIQQRIVTNLGALAVSDPEVQAGLSKGPWTMGWFIDTGISNHQKGMAIDVSLGKIERQEERKVGEYLWNSVADYTEYAMPTEIHELSTASVAFSSPVASLSSSEWRNVRASETMNNEALLLQRYCADAGLTPLASEWWHFNDLDCLGFVEGSTGQYFIEVNYSDKPSSADAKTS